MVIQVPAVLEVYLDDSNYIWTDYDNTHTYLKSSVI